MSGLAIEVENLVKVYAPRGREAVRAVDGLSFEVKRGTIFGLLGPNGAGKTTTLKVLNTLLTPTAGSARVMGHDVVAAPVAVRRSISVVLQETATELFLSVRDNLLTFARFYGIPADLARRRAAEVMEKFQLTAESPNKVQDLSGGFRRRVQVAKIFMVQTPVVFLDEFSTGMDPILKRAVMDLLREEASRGRTIVLTTQILSEAEQLCDDILIINRGRQVARGDLHALKMLSHGVHEITITFAAIPSGLETELARQGALHVQIQQNTVEFALKVEESLVLARVTELAKLGRVLRVEVGGASLEDVFIELMKKS